MCAFQINVSIRFLTSSTYFERDRFITRKGVRTHSFCVVRFLSMYVYYIYVCVCVCVCVSGPVVA
jgi:hypothetical protein